jgi:predicted DNA-binding transcriptional regulator AlpA
MRIGSLTEAAAKLGVTRPHLDRLVSQGKLQVLRGEHPKAPVFGPNPTLMTPAVLYL